jgi:UDP-N-acetylglucosamine acyltransferase
MAIHRTALVEEGAEIHSSCEIGPFAVIGPGVKMGPENVVGAHAVIAGDTRFGRANRVFPHACIGQIPQDLKWSNETSRIEIGDQNQFREFCTVHLGTEGGGGVTRIANRCLVMANAHVAHDVQLGERAIVANSVALAGHVIVEEFVGFGGLAAVHQFVRVGKFAYVSGGSMVVMDVAPYCTVQGDRAQVAGLNVVGLQRAGFSEEQIGRVKDAYKLLFRSGTPLRDVIAQLEAEHRGHPEIDHLVRFLGGVGERGLTR